MHDTYYVCVCSYVLVYAHVAVYWYTYVRTYVCTLICEIYTSARINVYSYMFSDI